MIFLVAILSLIFGAFLGALFYVWYVVVKLETHEAYLDDAGGLAWRVRE